MTSFLVRWLCTLLTTLALTACWSSPPSTEAGFLQELSGVWQARADGMLVTLVAAPAQLHLMLGADYVPTELGAVDVSDKTANVVIRAGAELSGTWTFRQVWVAAQDGFILQLTRHDGGQEELTFVRNITPEDLSQLEVARGQGVSADESSAYEERTAQPDPARSGSPSFDCDMATTGPEKLICASEELRTADVQVAQAFDATLALSQDKDALVAAHRAWRETERDACANVACLLAAHQVRLAQLTPAKLPVSTPATSEH